MLASGCWSQSSPVVAVKASSEFTYVDVCVQVPRSVLGHPREPGRVQCWMLSGTHISGSTSWRGRRLGQVSILP